MSEDRPAVSAGVLAELLMRGEGFRTAGRYHEAIALFERALHLQPLLAPAHNSLGLALRGLNRIAEAEAALRRAVEIRPAHAEAWANLGIVLCEQGRFPEGTEACVQAVALDADSPVQHRNLATALRLAGRYDEAWTALNRAVELDPKFLGAWIDLGVLCRDRRRTDDAVAACERAISLDPDNLVPYQVMGHALYQGGRWREAEAVYDRALDLAPDNAGLAIRRALLLPLVPRDRAEIAAARRQMTERLDDLLERPGLVLTDPHTEVGTTDFYLAYQGEDDRPIRQKLAALYLKSCPALGWEAPHCTAGPRRAERIKVGFLSSHLIAGHTIGKLTAGLIERLPRDRFETVLLRPHGTRGLEEAVERTVGYSLDLTAARRRVAAEELDVLIYPDIGMDSFTYFLAFSRLAPVQCVTWGHPVTTGIPNMDWFLSTADLDPPGSEAAYSETLARLPAFPAFVAPPSVANLPDRAALNLPEDRRLYVCTQTLFKVHPDFDGVLAEILRGDPDGDLVFIEGGLTGIATLLRQRLAAVLPDGLARVRFLPGLEPPRFLGLCRWADVLLDTFPFCGGNTSLEAFATGTPVVTLPTGLMRGRVTAAFYRRMGIGDLVARSPAHYVDLALRAARDREWRNTLSARIRDRAALLFEDDAAVAGLADFLERAVSARN
ncbi:MAG: tetratricopeptide repeat protein [Magnetospirillum sp. WYHS-4]